METKEISPRGKEFLILLSLVAGTFGPHNIGFTRPHTRTHIWGI